MITTAKHLALIGGIMLLIAGCSGGGGTKRQAPPVAPEPPPTMPEPPPVTPEPGKSEDELRQEYAAHPEFQNQPALEQVNAHYAYARGATGEGVVIGIIDSGVDAGHPKLAGKVLPDSYHLSGYDPDYNSCAMRDPDGPCPFGEGPPGHGTMVGGVIAASRQAEAVNGAGTGVAIHGVAFDAKLVSVGIPFGEPPEFYDPIDLSSPGVFRSSDQEFAAIAGRINPGVTAVNLSFGLSGNIEDYTVFYQLSGSLICSIMPDI